jgi:hypothetical protein
MGWLQGVTSSRDAGAAPMVGTPLQGHPLLLDMQVIVRLLCGWFSASIMLHITHHVARRAKVMSDHPHNADERIFGQLTNERPLGDACRSPAVHQEMNSCGRRAGCRSCAGRAVRQCLTDLPHELHG